MKAKVSLPKSDSLPDTRPTCRHDVELRLAKKQSSAHAYMRQSQVLALVPFSAASLWRYVASGEFPTPRKLGPRITAWKTDDVMTWLESKEV